MKTATRLLKVLVADDATVIRSRLVALLGEIPGVVVAGQAGGVAEMLAAIRALQPDVVTLDLSLPDGTGLDVLLQMTAERLQSVVIVLTNYALPEYEQAARAAGARAFFSKSHQFTQAIEMIRHLADRAEEAPSLS